MPFFRMTKTILKSLFRKPSTVKYPFGGPRVYHANTRGKVLIEVQNCIFCGICQRKCPTTAITVAKADKKWTINRLRCISCGACVDVCPKKCLKLDTQYTPVQTDKLEESFNQNA